MNLLFPFKIIKNGVVSHRASNNSHNLFINLDIFSQTIKSNLQSRAKESKFFHLFRRDRTNPKIPAYSIHGTKQINFETIWIHIYVYKYRSKTRGNISLRMQKVRGIDSPANPVGIKFGGKTFRSKVRRDRRRYDTISINIVSIIHRAINILFFSLSNRSFINAIFHRSINRGSAMSRLTFVNSTL